MCDERIIKSPIDVKRPFNFQNWKVSFIMNGAMQHLLGRNNAFFKIKFPSALSSS